MRVAHVDATVRKGVSGALKNCLYAIPDNQVPVVAFGEQVSFPSSFFLFFSFLSLHNQNL